VSDLPERQIRLAARYAEHYPAEIERALEANERLAAEAESGPVTRGVGEAARSARLAGTLVL
jgi:hypothetical protein